MSELQLGLLAIGAVVVVCVLAYNKWQELQYKRQAERDFGARHRDVLIEPGEGEVAGERAGTAAARVPERIEPTLGSVPAGPTGAVPPGTALSEDLDYIVEIEAGDDIRGQDLIDAAVGALAGFSKPVKLEGYDEVASSWEPLQHERRYPRARAGLQLVDRRGAAGAEDLTLFAASVQGAAAAVQALATPADRDEALKKAAELDRFCADVDIQIALHVIGAEGRAFPGTQIRALAEAAGLVLEQDGRFRRRDDPGRVIFELGNREPAPFQAESMGGLSTSGLTLALDVPRAPGGIRAFEQFRDFARQLAQTLDGRIVDDNRAEIGPAAFDQIQNELAALHRAMEAKGIGAGSPLALRLFA